MHFLNQSGRHSDERHMVFQYGFFGRICCCAGLVFLFTSYVSPFWIVAAGPTPINMGIWSICLKKNCRKIVSAPDILRATRILMTISTVCGLLAVSLAFLTNTKGVQTKWPLITNLATGIMTLSTMLLFGLSAYPEAIYGSPAPNSRFSIHFSWAFMVGCIAASFFLMSGLLYILIALQDIIEIRSKCHMSQAKKEQPLAVCGNIDLQKQSTPV